MIINQASTENGLKDTILLNWQNRQFKESARCYLLEGLKHSKHSIWLPGKDGICIEKAIELKICNKSSHVYLIEECRDAYAHLQDKLNKKKLWDYTNIHLLHTRLEVFQIPEPIDFAFIDLLGTFTPSLLLWFEQVLAKNLAPECRLCFTHLYKNRNNANLEELMELCQTKYKSIFNEYSKFWQYDDKWIDLAAFELKCCFHEWDFVLKSPYPYRDSHWGMTVYRCEDFKKMQTGLPKIEELLLQTKFGKRDIHFNRVIKAYSHANNLLREYCEQEGVDRTNIINTIKEVMYERD